MFGLHRGTFTLSLDFELIWGSRDLVADPRALLAASRTTRDEVFEPLLELFTQLGLTATWATVGHLFLEGVDKSSTPLHPSLLRPHHARVDGDWLDGVPAGDEESHPEWYGRSLIEALVAAGQEVGSHSFTHPIFGDPGCSREVADAELAHAVAAAAELGITLRSFVFPRNVPGHVDLLAKHGFTCWRPPEAQGPLTRRLPRQAQRAAHLARVALARPGPTVVPYRDEHGLWCIPGSAVLLPVDGVRRAIPVRQRVVRATGGIDRAAARRELFHLYLHPINLAGAPGPLLAGMRAILEHAARLRDRGQLDMLSMGQLAERLESSHSGDLKSPA
jgi:peptidoglycan/xylan/chitin deacetylase (PgdA/CDA1 family)